MRRPGGFTLLELLVTLVVLALAAAVLVVKSRGSETLQLDREAHQLAALLRIAQQEVVLKGVPVRLVFVDQGYAFEQLDQNHDAATALPAVGLGRWLPLQHEPMLRPRAWQVPGVVGRIETDGKAQPALVLSAGQSAVGVRVVLTLPPHHVWVQGLPGQGFVVQSKNPALGQNPAQNALKGGQP